MNSYLFGKGKLKTISCQSKKYLPGLKSQSIGRVNYCNNLEFNFEKCNLIYYFCITNGYH
jgi:hypothetical protein